MSFDLLEHPADIGFRVRGATLEELFANGAHALSRLFSIPRTFDPFNRSRFPLLAPTANRSWSIG
jgi:hypothetical protein